ncbi:MAG: tRNA epoxyqueuosine(34) reductase QueG [Elusimicrobia bacterium]|nr:tRNA epoxyqueuosine(34) reductase QueG [Elusimicrobiota bacterium]
MADIEEKIKDIAVKNGASAAGITSVLKSDDLVKIKSLFENIPPDLSYLKSNIEKRLDIKKWYPDAKSVLLCAWQYWNSSMNYEAAIAKAMPGAVLEGYAQQTAKAMLPPCGGISEGYAHPRPKRGKPAVNITDYPLFFKKKSRKLISAELPEFFRSRNIPIKISRYALSRDYHKTIKKKLKAMLKELKTFDNRIDGRFFVDTSPVFEKKLSERAGLGWQGKNTLIINSERGSYFFIGGIALSIALKSDNPSANLCADCDLCIKACPTGALEKPGVLNPNKCISYWTTQSKSEIPLSIKEKLGGNIYGCDICQHICPYNRQQTAGDRQQAKIKISEFMV